MQFTIPSDLLCVSYNKFIAIYIIFQILKSREIFTVRRSNAYYRDI